MYDHDFYYIATILDPRIKTKWIEENVESPLTVIDRIRTFLKAIYPLPDTPLPNDLPRDIFESLEYQFVAPFLDQSRSDILEHDINIYLDTPQVKYNRSKTEDQSQWILNWWNANKSQYKCMALAAREILAIPSSEVDYERLVNQGRDLLSIRRYRISSDTIRTMMLLKGALKSRDSV
jgi:hypothetical protein